MRLGLHLLQHVMGVTPRWQSVMAKVAHESGFDSVWTAEAYGSDAISVAAWIAGQVPGMRVGTAVAQIPARSAALTAMTAATMDQITGGRFILGLGTSGPQVAEGWHGQRFDRALTRTREYVDVVRAALRRDGRLRYRGKTLQLPLPDGPGKAVTLTTKPVGETVPIYLGAIGPKNTELTGEIAEGWIPGYFAPEFVKLSMELLERGAARSGRDLSTLEIAPYTNLCMCDDIEAAYDMARPISALYVGGMGSREQNFYNDLACRYGFENEAKQIQELYLAGKKREAEAIVPRGLMDMTSLIGPAARIRDRLQAYRDAGVGTLIMAPLITEPEQSAAMLRGVAELI
jgi:F420-dependent oxidoreductase-like protein